MNSRVQLQAVLDSLDPDPSFRAWFQADQNIKLKYPCIVYKRDDSWVDRADNSIYRLKKRYEVTVITRDPDSTIPDSVESLDYCRFVRQFVVDGLYHTVFQLFF